MFPCVLLLQREYDQNEIDPYQGNQKQPDVEALDLPEDLNLENQDGEESDNEKEEEGIEFVSCGATFHQCTIL